MRAVAVVLAVIYGISALIVAWEIRHAEDEPDEWR